MMCAIMNKLRRIRAAARHRLVFDLRIPLFGREEGLKKPPFREIAVPGSRLTQPVFTKLANLPQKNAYASGCSGSLVSKRIVTKFFQDFLYFTEVAMRNIAALSSASCQEANHLRRHVKESPYCIR